MRVLFVSGEFPPMQGGVGDYTREIGLALSELGCQVQVVTSVHGEPVPGLVVHRLAERWDWAIWRRLPAIVHRERPDVVHIQYQAAAYGMHPAISFLPRRLRLWGASRPRMVVTFHDLRVPYLFPKAGRVRRWVVNELARCSDAAITTNRADHEQLSASLPAPPALIPIGSNIAPCLPPGFDRQAWRARWGAGPDDLLVCFFGFVNARKGVDALLHALARLADGAPAGRGPRLLMIGGQTGASDPTNVDYLAHIRRLIAHLELEERVHWTGFLPAEEVSACFAAADLCALPFHDGASFLHGTFHAALAHGSAIVTTEPRVPLPELAHGQNVYLVPRDDPPALAQALAGLGGDPDLRRRLGEGARALSEQFRWDRIAARTLALYHEIGAGGAP